jgi:hypothetical protein
MSIDEEVLTKFGICTHRWLIEVPNGPLSKGICSRCGMARQFHNDADAALLQSRKEAAPTAAITGPCAGEEITTSP